MLRPDDPTVTADYQIDPMRSPYMQILQPQLGTDTLMEVGFVWVIGSSRTNCIEYWYLYNTVSDSSRAPYKWPGYTETGSFSSATIHVVPASVPVGQTPSTIADYLVRAHNVTLTYLQATVAAGT